jgi:superfamily I DNA and RNA helicase
VQEALSLVDDKGALPADIVVIAVDGHAALAIMRAAAATGSESRFERTRTDPRGALAKRIRVLTVVECRGHDFPIALVVGVERLDGSPTSRTLLYQAMTRAQHVLVAYGVVGKGLSDELGECCVRMGLEGR